MKKETHIHNGDHHCYLYYHRNRVQRRAYYEIKNKKTRIDFGLLELDAFIKELEQGGLFQNFPKEDFDEFVTYINVAYVMREQTTNIIVNILLS